VNPKLKPPGTEHLKLKYYIPLSTSAFKSNLRRYDVAHASWAIASMLGVAALVPVVRSTRYCPRNPKP